MIRLSLVLTVCVLLYLPVFPQSAEFKQYDTYDPAPRGEERFRLGFWNVENFFDLENDSLKNDDAFTPEGDNRYTYYRYDAKKNGLARTIAALGGWEPMDLMTLSEVENRWVLEGLTKHSPLAAVEYNIIHEDSPDSRGIDVACIYRPDRFNLILYEYIRIRFPDNPSRTTRDLLYIKGRLPSQDTLHVFVNHWPSRWGGQFTSEPSRIYVASVVKQKVDSLNARFKDPYIVILGDFNDEPDDISLRETLGAKRPDEPAESGDLVNLSFPIKHIYGTHSFGGEWGVLDQIIVSRSLLGGGEVRTSTGHVGIFNPPWMLKKNAAGNDVINRTFQGPAYQGGYSDHLPIWIDLDLPIRDSETSVTSQ